MAIEEEWPLGWTLGLDIGSASIGWAAVDTKAGKLLAAGVRIFPAGVDDLEFAKGQPGSSNNTVRRQKRLQRRQIRRRSGRQRSLFLLLQSRGLLPSTVNLPAGSTASQAARPEARHQVLADLDRTLLANWSKREEFQRRPAPAHVLPYFLRARALDQRLEPHELGRVIYHLGQRRGFHSNRVPAQTERQAKRQQNEDDESTVKQGIGELALAIQQAGARSLGEYFAGLDPATVRIRRPWIGRDMFQREFEQIWSAQAPHHSVLDSPLKQRLRHLLYFQRPIAAGRPGACELESGQDRAPRAALASQRFRLLQKVNDLLVVEANLQERPLTAEERHHLLAALESEGDLTFAAIKKRKLVAVGKGGHLNLERGGEKRLPGNRTAAALRTVFGPRWGQFDPAARDRAVRRWMDPNVAPERRASDEFGLSPEASRLWAELEPEEGYARLSACALAKLLPRMETGEPFKSAEAAVYGVGFSGGQVLDLLPPVQQALPALANPAVTRALTELRKVVNALIREHGKPHEVRIELAREIKRNAKQRARLAKAMRDAEKRNKKAAEWFATEAGGGPKPTRDDLVIARLWEQSGGKCPYCGRSIAASVAFSAELAEVDHILPRNRFPDDSFANKVLACRPCNQQKSGRTPFEAFGGDTERWDQIVARVQSWGDKTKLSAVQLASQDELDPAKDGTFAARRLNDTHYATTQAARYLGTLFGGRDLARGDGSHRRVIFASSGLATATLRRAWCLESVLAPETNRKNRSDHRHHAVDALVVALTSNRAIQTLAAAAAADGSGQQRFRALPSPWPDFVASVRPRILQIQVSHRSNHRLRGRLHEETNYGVTGTGQVVRRPLAALTVAQAEQIVDVAARSAVLAKLAEVGGDARRLAADPPFLRTRKGALIPIRRVRVSLGRPAGLQQVPSGAVKTGGNHHIEIFVGRDVRGREAWRGRVVSLMDAARRRAACRCPNRAVCGCVISRTWDGEGDFAFLASLQGGDMVEMLPGGDPAPPQLYVVRAISATELDFVPSCDAGKKEDLKDRGAWIRIRAFAELGRRRFRKVALDPLGRVHGAGG